ncbi:MAG: hypothetical protein ACXVMS_02855 [Flavisolibacter sp.]
MSLNGKVQIGKWEYLMTAKSLLIDRVVDKVLLNQAFLDSGIMILKIDGDLEKPWLLMNEQEIPDLDAERYLKATLIKNLKLKTLKIDGKAYYYTDPENSGIISQTEFYDESLNRASISFKLSGNQHYEVQNGVIKSFYLNLRIETDKGTLDTVSKNETLSVNDSVFINGAKTPDGYYRLKSGMVSGFEVKDGKVYSIKNNFSYGPIFAIVFLLVILVGTVVVSRRKEIEGSNSSNSGSVSSVDTTVVDTTKLGESPTIAAIDTTLYPSGRSATQEATAPSNPGETTFPAKKDYYTLGSTISEVLDIQGEPSSIMGGDNYKIYSYGLSSITFINGRVEGFSNNGQLKIKVIDPDKTVYTTRGYFTIGSTVEEVLEVQGEPTSIMFGSDNYKIFSFGLSSVTFSNGIVEGYSNNGDLKIKHS